MVFFADDCIKAAKIVLAEFGLLRKILSDAGMNFISDKLKKNCRQLNIVQAIMLSNIHHHSNGQVEAYIKFVKSPPKMP